MTLLTSATDFAAYRELSVNIDDAARINPYIAQAQQFDVKPLLGELLFKDLIDNPTTTENELLLSGGSYTYQSANYDFAGLKAVIIFFAYARFLENQNINITRFGIVFKNNADVSERVDEKTLQRLVQQSRNQAQAYWDECGKYLQRNAGLYPLWQKPNSSPGNISISAVG